MGSTSIAQLRTDFDPLPSRTRYGYRIALRFLDALVRNRTVSGACRELAIPRSAPDRWAQSHDWFADAIVTCRERIDDEIEANILSMALDGWEEDVFHQGQKMKDKRLVRSESLARFVAERRLRGRGYGPNEAASTDTPEVFARQLRAAAEAANATIGMLPPREPEFKTVDNS